MNKNKGFASILIALLIVGVFVIGGGIYYLNKKSNNTGPENTGICGRNGEFCPGTTGYEERIRQEKQSSCASTSSPSITVISPNEGETFITGQQITIKWTSCNIQDVWLGLASGGKDFGEITYPNPIPASQGSYQWTVSNPARAFTQSDTNSYQIGIESQSPNVLIRSGTFIVNSTTSNNLSIGEIMKNRSLYIDKPITVNGSIFSEDIKSEMMGSNQYLNLRDYPNMNNNSLISMKIESDGIKKLLIDKYKNTNSDWINVEISGIGKYVYLPMNGIGVESIYIEVASLAFK